MNLLDEGRKAAAYKAVDNHVKDGQVIGIGTGMTIIFAMERLAAKVKEENLKLICIPSSFQSRQLIVDAGLVPGSLEINPNLDLAIDGADEVDASLNLIKGGGACLTQEKIVASCSKQLIIIATHKKESVYLGEHWAKGIPIEVLPIAYVPVKQKLEQKIGGKANLRMAKHKAGPVVTDNGNFILDWLFEGQQDWPLVNQHIKMTPGVVETGLCIGYTSVAYFGHPDGTVIRKDSPLSRL